MSSWTWLALLVVPPVGVILYAVFARLLAEINVESLIVNVLAALGGAAVTFGGQYVKVLVTKGKEAREDKKSDLATRRQLSAEERKDRKDALDQMREVVKMYQADKDSDRKLIHDLRSELQASHNERVICEHVRRVQERRMARQDRRIDLLEEALSNAGIPVPQLPPESDDHE